MPVIRVLVFATFALTVAGGRAAAADTPQDPGIEDQIGQGIALRLAGNDEAALAVFLGAEKRAPDSVRILLHISTAALATGKWIMAYDYLQKASIHRDAPYYQRHKAAIENVERAIAQRVGQLRVRGSPAGAEVRLSGEVVGTLPMNGAKAVEVGSYLLEVSKPGYFPLRRPLTVAGGGNLTQEAVELREQSQFLASAGSAPIALEEGPVADTKAAPESWWRARWVTWSLAGVGLAAAATSGIAFGIREQEALHWNDNAQCLDSSRPSRTRQDSCGGVRRDLETAQDVGVGAGITAVVFGGAALAHWLWTGHGRPGEVTAVGARQSGCTPGLGRIVCHGSF